MTVDELRNALKRKAIIFTTGGFRPTNEMGESWIGCVKWSQNGKAIPSDIDGNEMLPLACIFTGNLEYVPEEIKGIVLCNIFISTNILDHLMDMEGYYYVEMIDSTDKLESCLIENPNIKAFPLKPEFRILW